MAMIEGMVTRTLRSLKSTRVDLFLFLLAFVSGVGLYLGMHLLLHVPQLLMTLTIVLVMCAYAACSAFVPALRVRLDQAGDNAYYLGLLFTLTSMAVALYEFGVATSLDAGSESSRLGVSASPVSPAERG